MTAGISGWRDTCFYSSTVPLCILYGSGSCSLLTVTGPPPGKAGHSEQINVAHTINDNRAMNTVKVAFGGRYGLLSAYLLTNAGNRLNVALRPGLEECFPCGNRRYRSGRRSVHLLAALPSLPKRGTSEVFRQLKKIKMS